MQNGSTPSLATTYKPVWHQLAPELKKKRRPEPARFSADQNDPFFRERFSLLSPQMDCERCVTIHGPGQGCAASTSDAEGKAVYIFCADNSPCPVQYRILKGMRQSPVRTLTALVKQISQTQEDRMTTTTTLAKSETRPAPRTCAHPECKKELGERNASGYCASHVQLHKSNGNGAAAQTNGHAVAEKANGLDRQPAGGNGAIPHGGVSQQFAAERAKIACADKGLLRLILEAIPLEDKVKFATAWLSGQN